MVSLELGGNFFFANAQSARVETIVTGGDGSVIMEIKNRSGRDVRLRMKPNDSVSITHTHVLNEHDGSIVLDVLFGNTLHCQGRLSCMPANVCTFLQCDYLTMPTQATSTCTRTPAQTIMMQLYRTW